MTAARLISCHECDRMYRLKNGTAARAFRANRIPGRWSGAPSCGRPGKTLWVSAKRADELWGAK